MPAAFELSKVTVTRPGKTLLDKVSWTVNEGERWVVLGPNGAGKTTLMQIVGTTLHPTSGKVRVLGQKLGKVDVFELRTRIGHTSTTVADQIPPAESVRNTVLSAAYGVTGRWNEKYDEEDIRRAIQIMGELGISGLGTRTFGTLSEGERKRVLIARALMTDPELLLLDEPAAGLDLGAREDLIASLEILSLADDSPVLVMVSHHVEEIPVGLHPRADAARRRGRRAGTDRNPPSPPRHWGVRLDYDSSSRTMVDASVHVGQHTDIERTAEETQHDRLDQGSRSSNLDRRRRRPRHRRDDEPRPRAADVRARCARSRRDRGPRRAGVGRDHRVRRSSHSGLLFFVRPPMVARLHAGPTLRHRP